MLNANNSLWDNKYINKGYNMENTIKNSVEYNKLFNIIKLTLDNKIMRKIVFTLPIDDASAPKTEGVIFENGGRLFVGLTKYTSDNKADRKNIPIENATELLCSMALSEYKRTNIITPIGQCSVMISKKGKITILDKIKPGSIELSKIDLPIQSHNKHKNYIITPENSSEFLIKLGICSEDGKIHDKKMSKYRQINKFLEIVDDVYPELPSDGILNICDLCCGKSYLSFAVYHFLTAIKKREVKMYAVDLKADVIAFCSNLARQLDYKMEFICDDIANFKPAENIHMVVSLHACDIATDIVLSNAVRLHARVILSTPCCHHELQKTMSCPELSFITRHSILKQKLADAATDSLRCLALEYFGYEVNAFELIDPEETPKNVIIKGIFKNTSDKRRSTAQREFYRAAEFLGVMPFIGRIIPPLTEVK